MDDVVNDIQNIVRVLRGTDVRELELENGGRRIRLHRANGISTDLAIENEDDRDAVPAVFQAPVEVRSPLVGTFYRAGKPDMPPLVAEGSRVAEDTVVGIIEALQQLTEIEARASGTIIAVLATDGQPVEYGQVLFKVSIDG